MKAIIIFDNVNDLLYSKWDEEFIERMKSLSDQHSELNITDGSKVSQLLSPIITSQRVMAAQFGNTYSSMQCRDDTTIVFDEWLDHIFMIVSKQSIDDAQRELLDCKTFVQHICGQNINLLQSPVYRNWLSVLIDSRTKGDSIPGATGVIGESGATAAALNALKSASKQMKCSYQHYHLMLFVGDKQLALYSSRGTEVLTPPDLILMSIQAIAAQEYWQEYEAAGNSDDVIRLPWLSEQNSAVAQLCGGAAHAPCAPHSLHVARVAPRVVLVVLLDMELREVGVATNMASQMLANLRRLLLQRNLDMLPNTLDALEAALKKTTDALRKNKSNANVCARLSSRMLELRRSCTTTTPLTPETSAAAMHTALETVIELLKPDIPSLNLKAPLKELTAAMAPYIEFLKIKAMRYFSMGSSEPSSLTLHKYVEEFPGLIHFLYVDRTAGRFLAPDMADCADMLAPKTVASIVSRAAALTREGYSAATWRRGALHACSVLWWERGAPVRPARAPHPAAVRALPPPGDILNSFYRLVPLSPKFSSDDGIHEELRELFKNSRETYSDFSIFSNKPSICIQKVAFGEMELVRKTTDGHPKIQVFHGRRQLAVLAFPNDSQGVTIKELICVHLGLLPATTAVQQARRLAHTVHDLAGDNPALAVDLL